MRGVAQLCLLLAITGCTCGHYDDDFSRTDAGPPFDGGPDPSCPPPGTPGPLPTLGACCARSSNAARLEAPELRVTRIDFLAPPIVDNVYFESYFDRGLIEERMNWLMRFDLGDPADASAEMGHGERRSDGTFHFFAASAPTPGEADRWDPRHIGDLVLDGETARATRAPLERLTLPMRAGDGSIMIELPLDSPRLLRMALSDDRTCVGSHRLSGYRTLDAGNLVGYVRVDVADQIPVRFFAIDGGSLCLFLAGMATRLGTCAGDSPNQTMWMHPPDSHCEPRGFCEDGACTVSTTWPPGDGACNAWRVEMNFSAHGVEIDDEPHAPPPCAAVQHFSYSVPTDIPLACADTTPGPVFTADLPVDGRAVAAARLSIAYDAPTGDTHYWASRVSIGSSPISYAVGDDVCAGRTVTRATLGYGRLQPDARRLELHAHEGSTVCVPGALRLAAGSTIDVWVEDPRPECAENDILYASYYDRAGTDTFYDWQTTMAPLPGASAIAFHTDRPDEQVRLLAVVEGTPHDNPNTTCGAESPDATLAAQVHLDDAIVFTQIAPIPASTGMGHLVLHTSTDMDELHTVLAAGDHTAGLWVGSNISTRVTTGGCCGDGALALIRLRDP